MGPGSVLTPGLDSSLLLYMEGNQMDWKGKHFTAFVIALNEYMVNR